MAEHYHPISHVSSIWHRSSSDIFHLRAEYITAEGWGEGVGRVLGCWFLVFGGEPGEGEGFTAEGAEVVGGFLVLGFWFLVGSRGQGEGMTPAPYRVRGRLPGPSRGQAPGDGSGVREGMAIRPR